MVCEGQACPVKSYFRYGSVGSTGVHSFLHVNSDQAGNRLQVPQLDMHWPPLWAGPALSKDLKSKSLMNLPLHRLLPLYNPTNSWGRFWPFWAREDDECHEGSGRLHENKILIALSRSFAFCVLWATKQKWPTPNKFEKGVPTITVLTPGLTWTWSPRTVYLILA